MKNDTLSTTKISGGAPVTTDSSGPGESIEPPCSRPPAEQFTATSRSGRVVSWSETETVPKECARCGYIARSSDDMDYHFFVHRLKEQRDQEAGAA